MTPKTRLKVALFGEAEKGQFNKAHIVKELPQLMNLLGNPPDESQGIHLAVQAILYQREVLFFRVEEEGYSLEDYYFGIRHLEGVKKLHALCMPGVGEPELLETSQSLCRKHKSILIMSQKDFYDYLTSR